MVTDICVTGLTASLTSDQTHIDPWWQTHTHTHTPPHTHTHTHTETNTHTHSVIRSSKKGRVRPECIREGGGMHVGSRALGSAMLATDIIIIIIPPELQPQTYQTHISCVYVSWRERERESAGVRGVR